VEHALSALQDDHGADINLILQTCGWRAKVNDGLRSAFLMGMKMDDETGSAHAPDAS
jgi:hypothetical protein